MRRILILFIALLIAGSVLWYAPQVLGLESFHPTKKVLVVYEKRFYWRSNEDIAKAVDLLLHHFAVETKVVQSTEYRGGMASLYDAVVYMPMEVKTKPPQALLKDLAQGTTPILWLGNNIDSYFKQYPQSGVEIVGESAEYTGITYNNQELQDTRQIKTTLMKIDPKQSEILAWQKKGTQAYPLAFHKGNLWFIGRLDFRQANVVITADILHSFLGQDHPENHQAFIRIEDVHPLRETAKLKDIADLLALKKIPFLIALIPVYTDGQGQEVTMSERPEFVDAIKYMVSQGGSVVLHGYTHQVGNEETGRGFEFWDKKNNLPLAGDNTNYTKNRLELGLLECLKNGVVPLAFEPPHYGMSEEGYQYLRSTGATLIAGIQTSDKGFSTTTFPVVIGANPYLNEVIPENLSFINTELPDPVAPLLTKSREIRAVRDGMAGAFFHPYLDLKYLDCLTEELRKQGYAFLDLKATPQLLQTEICTIKAEQGRVNFWMQSPQHKLPLVLARLNSGLIGSNYHLLQLGTLLVLISAGRIIRGKYKHG